GTTAYQNAVNGLDLGVDKRGLNMNAFLGVKVLTDLLIMGRVGVFVDAPALTGEVTMADTQGSRPYLYFYPIEDILSWTCSKPEEPSTFQAILLRDVVLNFDQRTYLPTTTVERFRMLWINRDTGFVNLQFLDTDGNPIDRDGNPGGVIELELNRIPFVLLDIGDSMIKDVVNHQIALLNLGSSDINYALKSNFPFYVEQRDLRANGAHLKQAATDGSASAGGQPSADTDATVGVSHGRFYDKGLNAPTFIAPPSEPLGASLKLQEKLSDEIRKLVNLSVASLASRQSAESKIVDNQGLEAGLSYIGLVLENAERQIAEHWASYEERKVASRKIATIKYPDIYALRSDADRIAEANSLVKLMAAVPGRKIKRELAKCIVLALLGGKISVDDLESINSEIDSAPYTTSDVDTIIQAVINGICGEATAAMALGFDDGEHLKAREDHALRAIRVLQAQKTAGGEGMNAGAAAGGDGTDGGVGSTGSDPAARGLPDLSTNQAGAGKAEKAASRDTTLSTDRQPRVRGEGKSHVGD
ncbi:MAG: hypothetical protein ABSH20_31960, partial [Tepidisphaeraceae bacterium]